MSLSAAANIFLGTVESPLFVRPYLKDMTRCGLFTTMSCGMAGMAGMASTVTVFYASIFKTVIPGTMGHIIIVSIIGPSRQPLCFQRSWRLKPANRLPGKSSRPSRQQVPQMRFS